MELTIENKIIKIELDKDSENPRDWDNLGTLVLNHPKHDLACEVIIDYNKFKSWEDVDGLKDYLISNYNACIILSVYISNHSGLTISTIPFNTGQIGFIFITKKELEKEYGVITQETIDLATIVLKEEIKMYNYYFNNEVYSFIEGKIKTCPMCKINKIIYDGIWKSGYYGPLKESGLIEDIEDKELKELVKNYNFYKELF